MAQNFRRYTLNSVGTSPAGITAANSYDTIISIRLANLSANIVLVDAYINDGSNDIHLIKAGPIPAGSSLELIDGGSKIILSNADQLFIKSDTASSLDAWISVVDDIST
jgi:subtilisin family serine protease